MAGVVGIEPTSKVLETPILPLNHTPIGKGLNPSRAEKRSLKGAKRKEDWTL